MKKWFKFKYFRPLFNYLLSFIFLWLVAGLVKPAWAADLTVTCDGTLCSMSPYSGAALFSESDLKPSFNIPRDITVINNGGDDCQLLMWTKNETDPDNLALVLFTVIDDGAISWFGAKAGNWGAGSSKNLADLFAAGDINLGTVGGGQTVNYLWAVTMDPDAGNQYQAKTMSFDFDVYFTCGQAVLDLAIEKDNDRKGDSLGIGDTVSYTIIVVNNGPGTADNVQVEDVPPVGDYFDYLVGSGYFTCTDGTFGPVTATGSNPYYWLLGDMVEDESCTLTYKMVITKDTIPGEHNNIARAFGQGEDEITYYSNVVIDPILVGQGLALSASYSGEVLGAATSIGEVLGAATGSKTFWLVLSLLMILLGSVLKILNKRKMTKILKTMFLVFSLSGIGLVAGAKSVSAVDTQSPVVAIVKLPEYLNKKDFEISYTALDAGESGLRDVKLEYQKEGEGWNNIGTYSDAAKKVSVNGKIGSDAKYHFKATACDHENNCAFSQTSTNIDTSAPPKPESYSKEKIGVQSYKIKWHNPNSDDLDKVYIYRSDKRDFDANDSTEVAQVSVSKNTDSDWTDAVVPDPSKEYYYVIRSVDKAGNGSDLVGDLYTSSSGVVQGEQVSGQEAVSGQEPFLSGGKSAVSTGGGQILGEETETASQEAEEMDKELVETDEGPTVVQDMVNLVKQNPWTWLSLGGLLLIVSIYWLLKLKK